MTSSPASRVTVVIATRDRRTDLELSLPRHEGPVILVDNGSTDGTTEMVAERFPDIRVVELDENHGATARNIGVQLASTPYVAFADDDSWWDPGALDIAAEQFDRHPRLALLAAQMRVGPTEWLDPICLDMDSSPLGWSDDLPGPNVLGFLACGSVVRRTAFLACGGFDEVVFFAGEEERLALDLAAAGWGLAYVDKVVAHHHPSPARCPHRRRVTSARNQILTAVMRRPWPVVAHVVLTVAVSGPAGRAGVAQAVRRAPMALARRRRLPPRVEKARQLLQRPGQQTGSSPDIINLLRGISGFRRAVTRRLRTARSKPSSRRAHRARRPSALR
jgi:GT2 family glycosyltransferase